jgi:hypothetical protein
MEGGWRLASPARLGQSFLQECEGLLGYAPMVPGRGLFQPGV